MGAFDPHSLTPLSHADSTNSILYPFLFGSYQFNPASYDHDVVVSILIKALLALPYPDFKLSLALLGEAPLSMDTASSPSFSLSKSEQKTEDATETPTSPALASVAQVPESYLAGNIRDPLIQRLAKLQLLLSNAHFVQFWEALKSEDYAAVRNSLKSVPTFDTDVRRLVIETVAPAFKRISCARLAKYLDLPVGELPAFVAKVDGWKVEGDYVVVPPNADNEIKAVTVNEQIQVEQLHKLIVQATPAPFPAAN